MRFRLDHVVIAVSDLARAVDDYRMLGFTVQMGGRHPGRASHNALVAFGDGAYLELIAWPEPGPAERWYNELTAHGEGFLDFALIPEDMPRAIDEARARGLPLDGPLDGGRVRPDGRELRWQTATQATFDLPFLCGDVTARELRVPEGEARRHANGALGVASVTVAVHDVEVSRTRYRALLGTPQLTVGETRLVLVARIGAREGPCAMAIRTSAREKAGALDPALTHGAAIELTLDAD
jgi:catechol 2,3-dioxygenase-like lactoylglutathione lyase family enzyme